MFTLQYEPLLEYCARLVTKGAVVMCASKPFIPSSLCGRGMKGRTQIAALIIRNDTTPHPNQIRKAA
jgi:hypothetical protein